MEEQLIYIIMIASIALSALCSMLEATLLSTPISFITGLEEQGVKGAERLKKLKQNPDRPISAILCLNTIANTVGASIVGSLVYEVYGDALVGHDTIKNGDFKELIEALMQKPVEEMKELYNTREIEK